MWLTESQQFDRLEQTHMVLYAHGTENLAEVDPNTVLKMRSPFLPLTPWKF